jgi:type IV secretion system protein VirD4
LQAIFYYVWLEEPLARRNFETVLQLLGEAEVTEKNKPSKLDVRMKFLEESSPLGSGHPAVKQYNKCMRGAGDTVRSIIISANSRLAFLENKQVLRMLSKDEMNLSELGIGVNGDGETRTALFCVIPDSDKSYNFIIGMLYTQIFQELYYQADFNCGGRLPIHVTFMLDEFANVALPDDYCSLLSTMRSREISSVIIIQNLAQIKALFKDTWETIPGNCDTLVYLGGNEQSTHKYVSELLGKGTIDKKSSGESKGRQGSSSRNYDVLGRELLTPDEARKLDNRKCLIFIRGFDPIIDNKFIPYKHPAFAQTADGKGEAYVHSIIPSTGTLGPQFEILGKKAMEYYEKLKEKGENVYIDSLKYEEFKMIQDSKMNKRFARQTEEFKKDNLPNELRSEHDIITEKDRGNESTGKNKAASRRKTIPGDDTITNRLVHWNYSEDQKEELKLALKAGVPKHKILDYFYPETSMEEMQEVRNSFLSLYAVN